MVDSVFNSLLEQYHSIDMPEDKSIETSFLAMKKECSLIHCRLCYKSLKNKFKRSSNSLEKNSKYLIEINNIKDELPGGMQDESEDWLAVVGGGCITHIGSMMFGLLSLWSLRMIFDSYRRFLPPIPE